MSAPGSVRAQIGGAGNVLVATVIAGVLAYLITWLVPRVVGFADYAPFAVFWSATYLVVGATGGLGQEFARSTVPIADGPATSGAGRARSFAAIAALAVSVVIVGTAVLWAPAVFPSQGWALVAPVAVGCGGYVLAAALSGTFAGAGRWTVVAALMLADAVIRVVLISVTLAISGGVVALAWAVALPFPLAVVAVWPFVRRSIAGRTVVDVGPRRLAFNSLRTVIASVGMSLMITGLPLLVAATSPAVSRTDLSLVILSLTLVRAPLVVIAQSLQSYLVVSFRGANGSGQRFAAACALVVLVVGALLAGAVFIAGPALFALLFPSEPLPDPGFLAVLVASSALLAIGFVVGSRLLARPAHGWYAMGWAVGAIVTLVVMVLPLDLELRVGAAVLLGPTLSLASWSIYLSTSRGPSADSRSSGV